MTPSGRGVYKAVITLTDSNGEQRYAISNPFGFYRFTDVPVGGSYLISAKSKQFEFVESTRLLTVTGDLDEVNFIAPLQTVPAQLN